MKKICLFFLTTVMLAVFSFGAFAEETTVETTTEETTAETSTQEAKKTTFRLSVPPAQAGDEVTLLIGMTSESPVKSFSFSLLYDESRMQVSDVSVGDLLSNAITITDPNAQKGVLNVECLFPEPLINGGTVLAVRFLIFSDSRGSAFFPLKNIKVTDSEGNDNEVDSVDGMLNIIVPKTEPTTVPEPEISAKDREGDWKFFISGNSIITGMAAFSAVILIFEANRRRKKNKDN